VLVSLSVCGNSFRWDKMVLNKVLCEIAISNFIRQTDLLNENYAEVNADFGLCEQFHLIR
jgi:hypothetical protein